jgi:hypothetical protein
LESSQRSNCGLDRRHVSDAILGEVDSHAIVEPHGGSQHLATRLEPVELDGS